MNILRNSETKKILTVCTISFLLLGIISTIMFRIWFEDLSSKYATQNIALVGAILEENPELESKIIPLITKGDTDKYYQAGKKVMDKYYYVDNLDIIKNSIVKEGYKPFYYIWFTILGLLFAGTTLIIMNITKHIFSNIKSLGIIADNMVEGKFNSERLTFKEGELSIFYSKFNHMGERLERALTDLKKEKVNLKNIINDISHQLKTPLAALISYNDILKNYKDIDKEAEDKFINLSSEQLDRMDWLITTLLKYARIESNAINYNKDSISLKETIEYAVEPLRIYLEEKNQKIILNISGEGFYKHDKNWVAESISNILKNAIEHTGNNGEIKISMNETPLSISIIIEDSGEGIDNKELKNIFKRFYKGKNSMNPKSIGIGLSLSKKIIESHNGSIKVDSKLGVGTKFDITFLKGVV